MKYPLHLCKLIEVLKRLPGVGNKSAERFAFQMLDWTPQHLKEMSEIIHDIPQKLQYCAECGCLTEAACLFCIPRRQSSNSLCIVASPRDVFSIEETREYHGLYHVLGAVLSPLNGIGVDKLNLHKLKERILKYQVQEVVIALDSTLEGDATSLYIKQELETMHLTITRLAFGLPMGSALDYVDGGTLARAFLGRNRF